MQAVILAAGMGKRLGKLTQNSTKCMVPFNDRRLIDYTVDAAIDAGVNRIVMVVGHGAHEVKEYLGTSRRGVPVHYVLNEVYDRTNNIFSLLLARHFLTEDHTLLLESDLIFEKEILIECAKSPDPNVVVVAKYESWMDGTVTLLDDAGRISSFISKKDFKWADSDRYYKTVNIYKLSREFCQESLIPFLDAYISSKGMNGYYEEVLKVLTFLDASRMKAHTVDRHLWYEIDDVQDLDIACSLFAGDDQRLTLFQKRYGGYWRFSQLKDFCYLVNPYFPPVRMVEEMQNSYQVLLASYPSGLSIQNLLAAKLCNCDQSHVLVGNGATELIKGLMVEMRGRVGMAVPTFNEYYETLRNAEFIEFHPRRENFSYTVDDLLQFAQEQQLSTLVLINPDNPTGHFLSRDEVLRLTAALQERNVMLILDESFVDFVDGTHEHTLIDQGILDQHRNLVVMKSISKSYGVPGLRLGIMASGNMDVLATVKAHLSIWNINSFGEHFLQTIGKYTSEYQAACKRLVEERTRYFESLKGIPYLRPIESKANYVMCEVTDGKSSAHITQELMKRHWIFIKDCAGKKGIGDRSFIRLAVRDALDNELMIESLRSLV